MKLLLISNSTNPGEQFLDYPKYHIQSFLGNKPVKAVFIPYAAVTFSFDEYEKKVKERFNEIGHDVVSIHHFDRPVEAIKSAEAVVVGGGNTFHLLRNLQLKGLLSVIRERVLAGTPYIGWSAGANVSCPTICTTNDMPIVETDGLKALNLIHFQINPHYTDFVPAGHGGETRDQRIGEFLIANPEVTVAGLREGTMFKYENNDLQLIGNKPVKIFKANTQAYELDAASDFSFLMK